MSDDNGRVDELKAVLMKHAKGLLRHFDTVQIFASIYDPSSGETEGADAGFGNWHARYGHVQQWLASEEERMRIRTRNQSGD